MKKEFVLSILILLLLPPIFAVEISVSKNTYQPQELLQAEISGNFISLTASNINIFKENKLHPEPVIKGLTKQNNKYYFYALLPNQEGNFTFTIDAEYNEGGIIKSQPITKQLVLVKQDNSTALAITPGFIVLDDDSQEGVLPAITLRVKSISRNTDLTATFQATGETKEITLIQGIQEVISFYQSPLPPQQTAITLNDYTIPVFLLKKTQTPPQKTQVEFIPVFLSGTITQNSSYVFTVLLKNTGQTNITNITFSSDLNATIAPEFILLIQPNDISLINITLSVGEINGSSLIGKITASATDTRFNLPAVFNFTTNKSEVKIQDAITAGSNKPVQCSQLGKTCTSDQTCTGETVATLDGPCCLGQCITPASSGYGTIAGVLLIIFLIALIGFAFWRMRQRRKNKLKSPQELLEDRSQKYKQRMQGKEVRRNIDRV